MQPIKPWEVYDNEYGYRVRRIPGTSLYHIVDSSLNDVTGQKFSTEGRAYILLATIIRDLTMEKVKPRMKVKTDVISESDE